MTGDAFPASWSGRIIEFAKIIGAVSIIFSAGVGVWAWTAGPVADFFDRIDMLVEDVASLKAEVARANGDDRVLRQPMGQSYIKEPVSIGENVVMFMVAGRTKLGADCRLTEWVPIFTDERNIPTPGERARSGPVARQINDDLQTLRIEMVPPATLQAGRVTVYLTLTYSCPDAGGRPTVVFDQSAVLAYELLPKSEQG